MRTTTAALLLLAVTACGGDDNEAKRDYSDGGRVAMAYASGSDRLSPEELEAGRMQMDWREFIERDTTAGGDSANAAPRTAADSARAASQPAAGSTRVPNEKWEDISIEAVNAGPAQLPLSGDVAGPSVLRVQVLLDRALFSPGVIDGKWGRNTEKAIYWLQRREGITPTGEVDEATWQRLVQLGGQPQQLVREQQLSAEDVSGPFVTLPSEYYDRKDMECQCYESLAEKLAETYHTTEGLLAQLNPGVDLNSVEAGTTLNVPNLARQGTGTAIAKLVISDGGRYLHAQDAQGRIVYHFPATLGSDYSPSPSGDYRVTNIAPDPSWHYQPDLLEGVPDSEPDAVLPPGPNNAVGVVWMQLSKPHYGIHGTSAPETIGYATSNGCIRLTNWDVRFLSEQLEAGVPVQFRDVKAGA